MENELRRVAHTSHMGASYASVQTPAETSVAKLMITRTPLQPVRQPGEPQAQQGGDEPSFDALHIPTMENEHEKIARMSVRITKNIHQNQITPQSSQSAANQGGGGRCGNE